VTTLADLENAYAALLSAHAPVTSSGQANDAFEVYTLSLILRAAKEEGATIRFESSFGVANPSPLLFRTSPGRIFTAIHDFSHAAVLFPDGLEFESHIGVYVEGLAGVLHECDVLVIDAEEGRFCRRNRVHPKKSSMALSVECKFYAGKLGIDLGRQFLGVTTDLGTEGRFFLSNSTGKSVDRVLAHHNRGRFFGLTPLDVDAELQVIALFRSTFRNIRAKRR
jgi:hypothetical protein